MDIENIHKNSKLLIDNIPYDVVEVEFVKPGKGRAIYRLRLRNLFDNTVIDRTFHSGDSVEEARIAAHDMQYLYREGDRFVFMNTETFEQMFLEEEKLGNDSLYLKEGTTVNMLMMDDKPISVSLPTFVELEVVEGAMTTKTDTLTPQMKAAKMETGLTMGVPAFIKEGDIIKIDTRTGRYVERVSTKK